jgi:hypothetical protein
MPEAADLEAGLVAFLRADAATAALVGTRVFAGELPADETKFMPRQAIVLRGSGGVQLLGDTFVEVDTQRIDVFTYGATPRDAARVMRTAALALRQLRTGVYARCMIHWVNSAGGSSSAREPVTEWPRQFQSFQVMHGLVAIEE